MTDFDPDAYLDSASGGSSEGFDPDQHLSDTISGKHQPGKAATASNSKKPSWWDSIKSGAETDAAVASSGVAGLAGGMTYLGGLVRHGGDAEQAGKEKETVEKALTYVPRSDASKADVAAIADKAGYLGQKGGDIAGDKVMDATGSPLLAAGVKTAYNVPQYLMGGRGLEAAKNGVDLLSRPGAAAAEVAPQAVADAAYAKQSQGAAAKAPDVTKLTPETRDKLQTIGTNGGKINTTALERHHDAESLPVPVRLTAGQARGDTAMISDEFNAKGKSPDIGNRYNEQDAALQDNLATIHREAAPGAVGNDDIQNGQSVLDSLKRYDAPKKQAVNDAYKAAKDANGGDLQMDGSKFADAAEAALKPQSKSRFLPSSVQGIIEDVKSSGGKMSLDDFEAHRTTLANEVAKAKRAGDGNAVAAINKVRDVLEETPPADGTSASAKALYDKARGLAKSRFDEMKADPAYEAAVGDPTPVGRLSPEADKFTTTYVTNGAKADLQQLRAKLDTEGHEAMTSATMNYLKKQAGLEKGKFLQNGYNTALNKVLPKADELLGSKDLTEQLQQVGRVGKYTQEQTRGGYANNSHTFVAAAKEHAAGALEGGVNYMAHGLPVGTLGRHWLGRRAAAKSVKETLEPGAGLED